jgi:hypothetical protein
MKIFYKEIFLFQIQNYVRNETILSKNRLHFHFLV